MCVGFLMSEDLLSFCRRKGLWAVKQIMLFALCLSVLATSQHIAPAAAFTLPIFASSSSASSHSASASRPPHKGSSSSCPTNFTSLELLDPTIITEIRYAGSHNFIGRPVPGYTAASCILTFEAAVSLRKVQKLLLPQGVTLKVYDCYRPQKAVDYFVEWSSDLEDEGMKGEFFPRVEKKDLFEDGYIATLSGHSKGSTVDVTLVPLPVEPQEPYEPGDELFPCHLPKDQRYLDNSIDMGTGFDCFDLMSHTDAPEITEDQRYYRNLLRTVMEKNGWVNYPLEWWHYTLANEPYPETYFDFDVEGDCWNQFLQTI